MTNEIVKTNNGNSLVVTERDRQAADLLRKQLPYGDKLTDDELLALASFSHAHGLDPRNGECYFMVRDEWTDRNGKVHPRQSLGVYPGIKGKRKKAREQIKGEAGGKEATFSVKPDIIKDPAFLGIDLSKVACAVKVTLTDDVSHGLYLERLVRLLTAGVPFEKAEELMGPPPTWTGYGIVNKKEAHYLKQAPIIVARKRAENDAITQRFDLPFADTIAEDAGQPVITTSATDDAPMLEAGQESEYEYDDAQFVDADPEETRAAIQEQIAEMTPEERAAQVDENIKQLGF